MSMVKSRSNYIEFHLNTMKEVEKTRHLKGNEYMEAILSDMDISELSGCDIYHSDPLEDMVGTVETDYDGRMNPDDV